jgi:cytochrome b involved in lipid metabolism
VTQNLVRGKLAAFINNFMLKRNSIAAVLVVIFIIGSVVIMYRGRPAMNVQNQNNGGVTSTPNVFSLSDVQTHNTPASCWTTISGSVYDLTTWINRHPGGPGPIKYLCGIDGTEAFIKQHGNNRAAKAALVLLKIGDLK